MSIKDDGGLEDFCKDYLKNALLFLLKNNVKPEDPGTEENCLKQAEEDCDNDVKYWKKGYDEMCKECRELHDKLAEAEKKAEEYKQKYNTEQEYAWKLRRQLEHIGRMYSNYYGTKSVLSKDIEKFLSDNLPPIWKRAKKNYEEKVEQREGYKEETNCGYWNEWMRLFSKEIKEVAKDIKRDSNELKNSGEL